MVEFYKHHIPDWMDGTEGLSDGAYRAYHVICQLIYLNEGPIALHEHGIAGRCNQSIRSFRKHVAELCEAGKILIENGRVLNSRAVFELEKIGRNRINAGKGGVQSGIVRHNPLKSHDVDEASLPEDRSLKEKRREEKRREERKGGADAPSTYAFEGNVIRLTQEDLDRWKRSYSGVPDLLAEIQAADAYYTDHPPKNGKWFFPVSSWMKRAHNEGVSEAKARDSPEMRWDPRIG